MRLVVALSRDSEFKTGIREYTPDNSTALCFLKAEGHIDSRGLCPYYQCILLLLIAVFLANPGLKQHALRLFLGLDKYLWFVLVANMSARRSMQYTGSHCPRIMAHIDELAGTEASASIKPVIVAQLVDFDSLLVVGQRRLDCHPAANQHTVRPFATR
jgi:hypothetical protein